MTQNPPSGDAPLAGTPPVQSPLAGDPQTPTNPLAGADPDSEPLTLGEAKKLRQEHKTLRDRLKAYEEAEEKAKLAAMSEAEKLAARTAKAEKDRDDLVTQSQERIVRAEVRGLAREQGIDPKLALRIIDYSEIDYDESGDPKNLDKVLAKAIKDYGITPQSVTPPASPQPPRAGATNPPRITGSGGIAQNEIPRLSDPRLWKR